MSGFWLMASYLWVGGHAFGAFDRECAQCTYQNPPLEKGENANKFAPIGRWYRLGPSVEFDFYGLAFGRDFDFEHLLGSEAEGARNEVGGKFLS